ncbi:RICIN domain-containing protein [Kitasatospora sp. NPDC001527]|uniref:RICIN domain-containing protein n=1 Tax=Kitasatospora sp. NPDC001527 TaxID=3154519 RepID=UPI00331B4528
MIRTPPTPHPAPAGIQDHCPDVAPDPERHDTTRREVPWPRSSNVHSGKCLDVAGGRLDNGTPLMLSDCHGDTSQRWHWGSQRDRRVLDDDDRSGRAHRRDW